MRVTGAGAGAGVRSEKCMQPRIRWREGAEGKWGCGEDGGAEVGEGEGGIMFCGERGCWKVKGGVS